jgi:isopenicillin N synthase-like dioxygenase
MVQIISNGIFRSPVHRVMTNADRERLSLALFYSVDPAREIEPAAHLVDEKRPALYRKVKVNDYLAGFYGRFSEGAMAIDTVKI